MSDTPQAYPVLLGPDGYPLYTYKPYDVGFKVKPKEKDNE